MKFMLLLAYLLVAGPVHAGCANEIPKDSGRPFDSIRVAELTHERLTALVGERATVVEVNDVEWHGIVLGAHRSKPPAWDMIYLRIYALDDRKIHDLHYVVADKDLKRIVPFGLLPDVKAIEQSTKLTRLAINPLFTNQEVIGERLDVTQPVMIAYIDVPSNELRTVAGKLTLPERDKEPRFFSVEAAGQTTQFDQGGLVRIYGTLRP